MKLLVLDFPIGMFPVNRFGYPDLIPEQCLYEFDFSVSTPVPHYYVEESFLPRQLSSYRFERFAAPYFFVSPDITVHLSFPLPVILYNLYISKVIQRYAQSVGAICVPSINFVAGFEEVITSGIPQGAIISVRHFRGVPLNDYLDQVMILSQFVNPSVVFIPTYDLSLDYPLPFKTYLFDPSYKPRAFIGGGHAS